MIPVGLSPFSPIGFPGAYSRTDVQPFTYRDSITYTELQERLKEYVVGLADQINSGFVSLEAVVDNYFQEFQASELPAIDPLFPQLFTTTSTTVSQTATALGELRLAPTGDVTTDTANLVNAFAVCANNYLDLVLTPSPLGAIQRFACNTPLTWNLNRSSLSARGTVGIDFSYVSSAYLGAAFTVGTDSAYDASKGSHLSTTHKVSGFHLWGHNTDASNMDGLKIIESSPGLGNDMGTIESVFVDSFHDNLTFGTNTWNFDFRKCSFRSAHRYNINLSGGTGECQQFTECNVFGASNAAGTAANIYSPAGQTVDARFYGGSFDYPGGGGFGSNGAGGIQGIIEGATNLTFDGTHIEDGNTGPMFTYSNNTSGYGIDVTFINCFTSSTTSVLRHHIHEIKASTKDNTVIRFISQKGSCPSSQYWVQDNSGLSDSQLLVEYRGFNVSSNFGSAPQAILLVAPSCGYGTNMRFGTANTFVTGGILGWTAGAVGTWSYDGTNTHNGGIRSMSLVGTGTTGTNLTYQSFRISPDRRPIQVTGYQQVTAYTSGSVGLYVRFLAEDRVTVVGTDQRIGIDQAALTGGWVGKTKRIIPPSGAQFLMVYMAGTNFNGTAQWADIEAIAV